MKGVSVKQVLSNDWLPLAGVIALWVPAMIAASYVWGHGEYYDYGWFVPPAALWLAIRRWNDLDGPVLLLRRRVVLAAAAVLVPWILVLRILGHTDLFWRLPIGLLGMTAVVASHGLIAATRGGRAAAGFAWISLLWLSALPWPSVVEVGIVHHLTRWVVAAAAETFQLFGKPVEVVGDRLRLHGLTVEVTDGCSGVRSLQGFVMATWFFAELQRLSVTRTGILLTCACGAAFVVNVARSFALAQIRFERGPAAFERAHDSLGLLAFLVSAAVFYLVSGRLAVTRRRTVVKRVFR